MDHHFSRSGAPTDISHVESFNDRFRDECPKCAEFMNLSHPRGIVEAWRIEYNPKCPYGGMGFSSPVELARAERRVGSDGVDEEISLAAGEGSVRKATEFGK